MKFQVLILDDEEMVCKSLKRILEDKEKEVRIATSVETAKQIMEDCEIDLVLLDYRLQETDGIAVMKNIREAYPETMIIMITAYGNIDVAVEAMKLGAYDFIQKKEEADFIRFTVRRALDTLRLKKEVEELRLACQAEMELPEIISVAPAMEKLLSLAREYARIDSTVLISGETGTGKGLLARFIHINSPRFNAPFVSINCAAIPHELLESELFGYEKGAFTGANQKGKVGLIERASGGTLFLDEISELTLELQTKLLHVLETREFFRVGAVEPSKVDVRFVAATNANLKQRVEQNQFRMDLFYRLNVAALPILPLRERREDILPIAKHFIEDFNFKFNKAVDKISPEAEHFLESSSWPGNVRELRNMLERAMLLKKDPILQLSDFMGPDMPVATDGAGVGGSIPLTLHLSLSQNGNVLHEAQRQAIHRALELSGNNRKKAAELLGVPRTTLNYCIRRFGIEGM